MNQTAVFRVAVFITAMVACAGCGPDLPETASVSGRITYQGKPVGEGVIVFHPEKGRAATAVIAEDGSYSLTCFNREDGALLGRHRVTIESRRITDPVTSPNFNPNTMSGELIVEWLVPERYSRPKTTPLTAEVKPGRNTIDFDLPAQ